MRSSILSFLIVFVFFNAAGQASLTTKKFVLKGKITGKTDGYLVLKYLNKDGRKITDSSKIRKGNFYFTGNIFEPTLAFLSGDIQSIADDDPNTTSFYLEPGNMTIKVGKDHFKEIKVTGSKTQNENEILEKQIAAIANEKDSVSEKISEINYQFVISNPDSYLSAFLISLYLSRWPLETLRMCYDKLSQVIQESYFGRNVKREIEIIENNTPGKMAKEFSAIDLNGNSIRLSGMKGKYILLDFWASWCMPCRQSFPVLIELFKNYHAKGLEVIAISSDDNLDAWKKAIEKDGISLWHNISGIYSEKEKLSDKLGISQIYGVHTLPTKFLIDKDGKIIGRYGGTGGENESALYLKLKGIFE